MLNNIYLFIIPILVVAFYLGYKYYIHNKDIKKLEENAFQELEDKVNNLDRAKEDFFTLIEGTVYSLNKIIKSFFHWLLHFFVLFLKYISVVVDYLYEQSRDFFLKTATKEKDAVSTFWHHLKEYKKEKEEKEDKN